MSGISSSPYYYEFELGRAVQIIAKDCFSLKKGEIIVITADTQTDLRVVNAMAQASFSVGAKPMIIWMATPPGPGGMVDDFLPASSLRGALMEADCWIEFNRQYINYSKTMEYVCANNKKLRYLIMPGMVVDVLVRMFVNVDQYALRDFVELVAAKTRNAKKIRITSPNGEDVEFENDISHPVRGETGFCTEPGMSNLSGQIGWCPALDTINGVIVFDGSLVPQFGLIEQPVKVYMEKGVMRKVEGGRQAIEWEAYLRSFNHPQMLRPAHVCYGFHPGAKITGQIGEDERVWGCTQWGFGAIGSIFIPPDGIFAPSHTDGITLNSSIWLDGEQITKNGKVINKELKDLAKRLGK
jgi:2,5-dihydroxypyridine 5,6-dioxygenase